MKFAGIELLDYTVGKEGNKIVKRTMDGKVEILEVLPTIPDKVKRKLLMGL